MPCIVQTLQNSFSDHRWYSVDWSRRRRAGFRTWHILHFSQTQGTVRIRNPPMASTCHAPGVLAVIVLFRNYPTAHPRPHLPTPHLVPPRRRAGEASGENVNFTRLCFKELHCKRICHSTAFSMETLIVISPCGRNFCTVRWTFSRGTTFHND